MFKKKWVRNSNGNLSQDGKSSKWCIYGGKHKKMWGQGDTTEDQWICKKCEFHYGPTGIFEYGCVKQGHK